MLLFREKQLESFKHSLLIRRMIWEKVLFGTILILIGAAGGFFGNKMLESHRNELLKERFLLEKRLESIINVRTEYSNFLLFLNQCVKNSKEACLPSNYNLIYQNKLENLALTINIEGLLFSTKCMEKIQNHIILFMALKSKGIENSYKYIGFLMEITSCFDSLLKDEMGQVREDNSKEFKISDITREEILIMGIENFFDNEYERWEKWRKNI